MNPLRSLLGRPLPPRVRIVAAELRRFRRPSYLEIGVHTGVLFTHVRAARKVGVDPEPAIPGWKWWLHPNTALRGSLVEATSDEYFDGLEPEAEFDVVFVDGEHTFEQSLRDVENGLAHLAEGGVVLVHDVNPPSAASALSDPAAAARLPGGECWCGDVWRTIVWLRAVRDDLEVHTFDTDFGVGVVRRGSSKPLALDGAAVAALAYGDLERDRPGLLGLRPPP
ncbi:MAG: class I SAM-dependent methyltransferase [Solirubrobacterales bacterium]